MAERRMFAKTIVDSDAFLDMPIASQCLYFHLAMRADDEGFVNKAKSVARVVGAKEEDFRPLVERRFVIVFDDGVLVIKHWRIHNWIRTDRLQPTKYQQHKNTLSLDENNAYSGQPTGICQPSVRQLTDKCHTEVRLGKDSIDKDSKDTSSSEVATAPADKVKVSFEKDSRPYKCALYLANQIAERIPGKKYAEATLQSWAKDFDRVNRLDGHSWDDIGTVLTFSQNDSFWQGNILSGAKFRKQYDQLYLKMQKEDA